MAAMTERLSKALAWGAWLLSLLGWVLLLIGISAMQSGCEDNRPNALAQAGAAGYLGPVDCSRWLAFTWFIWSFHFLVLLLAPLLLAAGAVSTFRAGLVGFVALSAVLLMDMANTASICHNCAFVRLKRLSAPPLLFFTSSCTLRPLA
jgi:uncharacterized membrane protein